MNSQLTPLYQKFIKALQASRFSGEVRCDYASRLAVATDNSIYQLIPEAVLFPRSQEDVRYIMRLAHRTRFREIKLAPRGGGTAPNGQSLTQGIVIDCTKYMNRIIDIDINAGWVNVQPGIVLDELNQHLKPYNVYFAPRISPSNRATIGGMVSTNACGLGSLLMGRTVDHVQSLKCVLTNGTVFKSENIAKKDLAQFLQDATASTRTLYSRVNEIAEQSLPHYKKLPTLPRGFAGYNLPEVRTDDQSLNLNALLCGSEGTLAIVTECQLRLTPIPRYCNLIVVQYAAFADALHEPALALNEIPSAAEIIDDNLVDILQQSDEYPLLRQFVEHDFPDRPPVKALNIIEFSASTQAELDAIVSRFSQQLGVRKRQPNRAINYMVVEDESTMALVWQLRKSSVEMVTRKRDGTRQPVPFIEDTAVSPDRMADYIINLRKLLDKPLPLQAISGA